jgi:hypothetical protein
VDRSNPRVFSLPESLLASFPSLCAHPETGEFIDRSTVKIAPITLPLRKKIDPLVASSATPLCYSCHKSGVQLNPLNHVNSCSSYLIHRASNSTLLQCGYCDVWWHGDCLDPPMTGIPGEIGEETGIIDGDGVKRLKERTWGEKCENGGGFQSIRRKWMCPLHVEWAIRERKRIGSGWKFVSQEEEKV